MSDEKTLLDFELEQIIIRKELESQVREGIIRHTLRPSVLFQCYIEQVIFYPSI